MYICDVYKSSLRFYCQRFSNNSNPEFTDEEVLTLYLFCGYSQRYFGIKEIHTFAKEYLSSWFPKLPAYQTFCVRLNMLSEAFKVLVYTMIQSFKSKDCDSLISIVDSMPIVTCKGKNREGKVATEITSKGYCSQYGGKKKRKSPLCSHNGRSSLIFLFLCTEALSRRTKVSISKLNENSSRKLRTLSAVIFSNVVNPL